MGNSGAPNSNPAKTTNPRSKLRWAIASSLVIAIIVIASQFHSTTSFSSKFHFISPYYASHELSLTNELPFFTSVRVVSLANRPARRNHMQRLDRYLGLGLQFVDAVSLEDEKVLKVVKDVGNNTKADAGEAKAGHVACRMSHRKAIELADANDEETTLILEDDVDMESAFRYLSGTIIRDAPADWDIIFFGHTDFSDEGRHGVAAGTRHPLIHKSVEPQGGHAYALSRKGRHLLLSLLSNQLPELYPTDDGLPIDEIFMNLARRDLAKLYSILPDLVVQKALFASDIMSTEAGFDDGMHGKYLMDSALVRMNSVEEL